jgi:MbtH protein
MEMTVSDEDVTTASLFEVVLNEEQQYSIWPANKELPSGWKKVGKQAAREICLDYIKDVWTDMRPLSLRNPLAAVSVAVSD